MMKSAIFYDSKNKYAQALAASIFNNLDVPCYSFLSYPFFEKLDIAFIFVDAFANKPDTDVAQFIESISHQTIKQVVLLSPTFVLNPRFDVIEFILASKTIPVSTNKFITKNIFSGLGFAKPKPHAIKKILTFIEKEISRLS